MKVGIRTIAVAIFGGALLTTMVRAESANVPGWNQLPALQGLTAKSMPDTKKSAADFMRDYVLAGRLDLMVGTDAGPYGLAAVFGDGKINEAGLVWGEVQQGWHAMSEVLPRAVPRLELADAASQFGLDKRIIKITPQEAFARRAEPFELFLK